MLCVGCSVRKLSKEFPRLPPNCEHPSSFCYKCFLDFALDNTCPECKSTLKAEEMDEIKTFEKSVYQSYHLTRVTTNSPVIPTTNQTVSMTEELNLTVVNMNGKHASYKVKRGETVRKLKQLITTGFKVEIARQRLVFEDKVLEDSQTFHSSGISTGSVVQLLVVLFDFSKTKINNIIFDLLWGYPKNLSADYLDATCFLYGKDGFLSLLDYSNTKTTGVSHSGDVMDHSNRIGHHTIEVDLNLISPDVTKIFFTLSAFHSKTIGAFIQPTVKVYDKTAPTVELSSFSIKQAAKYPCVIMFGLERQSTGWISTTLGIFSAGNAKNYQPVKEKIAEMLATQTNLSK
uniref:Ubiquitin-like domain-containing protein n=1 Tax=Arcella intermedia TaxID=1963864 RepID=A0A6B2L9A8_9EUKA